MNIGARYKAFHARENMRLMRMLAGIEVAGAGPAELGTKAGPPSDDRQNPAQCSDSYAKDACAEGLPDRDEDCSDLG